MVSTIADILNQWESLGVFDYLLPFLLIFAVVFGILSSTNITSNNRGLNIIISLVVGMLSIRFDFTRVFFNEVFPRLGVGIAVILVLMILVGLFIADDERRFWLWGLGAIGFIIALIVLSNSFGALGWTSYTGAFDEFVSWIIGAVLLIGLIIAIASSGGKKEGKEKKPSTFTLWRPE